MEKIFDQLIAWCDPEPREGAMNMALDQALLETTSVPLLRIYEWSAPAVTIGYAQKLELLRPSLPPWPVTRRWTGGGVVFHDRDHTYSIIVPASCAWSQTRPVESYRVVHAALTEALVGAGFDGCRLATAEDVIDKPFCFEAPAVHDIVRGVEKIAGAGQRRSRIGFLHQGSVQNIVLDHEFWRGWARQMAHDVAEMTSVTGEVRTRALDLAVRRYGAESWLLEREDSPAGEL